MAEDWDGEVMAEDWDVEDLRSKLNLLEPMDVPTLFGGKMLVFSVALSYEELHHIKWALDKADKKEAR